MSHIIKITGPTVSCAESCSSLCCLGVRSLRRDGQRLHGAKSSDQTAEPSSTSGAGGNSVANGNEPQGNTGSLSQHWIKSPCFYPDFRLSPALNKFIKV